ncbi:hypothetical protein EAG08_02220 [Chryseobacterium sp. 3008163]|nr:hypothetical protein EAG08_02220 [Chryseobacterium sp. 3008163]
MAPIIPIFFSFFFFPQVAPEAIIVEPLGLIYTLNLLQHDLSGNPFVRRNDEQKIGSPSTSSG